MMHKNKKEVTNIALISFHDRVMEKGSCEGTLCLPSRTAAKAMPIAYCSIKQQRYSNN